VELRLDHIALLVKDLAESVAFYTGVLRFKEVVNPMGGTEIRWFEIGPNVRIHMQAGDFGATHVQKRTHFAFSARDLDETLAHLQKHGVAYSDMKGTPGAVNVRPDGMRAVFLQDPNGYWIEINDFQ